MKIFLSILKVALVCILIAAMLQTPYTWMIAAILFVGSILLSFAMPKYGLSYLICGSISAAINPNCADPLIGGLEVNLFLANKSDIDSYTFNTGNNTIIEAITMKALASHTIVYSTLVGGPFVVGETITGGTSSATAVIVTDAGGVITVASEAGGPFTVGETITGGTSSATAVIVTDTADSTKFYTYEGMQLSNEAKTTGVPLKYSFRYDHELDLIVFKVDGATKKELEALAQGLVVAVVEWKYKGTGGNAAFEVYGREQGLKIIKLDRDSANNDTQGAYQIQLKTPEGVHEGHLPATLFITDYSTTAALVAALL
jgi:energy-converting hydrogenase Eha subunit E